MGQDTRTEGKRWGKWTRVYFLDARLAGKLAILFVAAADNMEVDKNTSLLEGRKVPPIVRWNGM